VGTPTAKNKEKSEDEAGKGRMYFMNELLVEINTTNALFKTPCSLINTRLVLEPSIQQRMSLQIMYHHVGGWLLIFWPSHPPVSQSVVHHPYPLSQ